MEDKLRDSLHPADAPNPIVWCERCQRRHPFHTFTQGDYDQVIREGAQQLADAIDAEAAESVYGALPSR